MSKDRLRGLKTLTVFHNSKVAGEIVMEKTLYKKWESSLWLLCQLLIRETPISAYQSSSRRNAVRSDAILYNRYCSRIGWASFIRWSVACREEKMEVRREPWRQSCAMNVSLILTSNDSTATTDLKDPFCGCALVVTCFLSLVENFFVFAVSHNPTVSMTPDRCLIINMCVGNVCMALLMPMSAIAAFTGRWTLGDISCLSIGAAVLALTTSMVFSTTIITLDRLYAVVKPMQYNHVVTRRKVIVVTVGAWFLSLLVAAAPVLNQAAFSYDPALLACVPLATHRQGWSGNHFLTLVLFILYFTAQLFIIATYIKIYSVARESSFQARRRVRKSPTQPVMGIEQFAKSTVLEQTPPPTPEKGMDQSPWLPRKNTVSKPGPPRSAGQSSDASPKPGKTLSTRLRRSSVAFLLRVQQVVNQRAETKTAKTSFIIVLSFIVFVSPFYWVLFSRFFLVRSDVPVALRKLSLFLLNLNPAVTPAIYFYRSHEMRRVLVSLLPGRCSVRNFVTNEQKAITVKQHRLRSTLRKHTWPLTVTVEREMDNREKKKNILSVRWKNESLLLNRNFIKDVSGLVDVNWIKHGAKPEKNFLISSKSYILFSQNSKRVNK